MPGMMETILNLGLNDRTVKGLTRQSGNPASPTTRTAGSSRCTATWCSTSPRSRSSSCSRRRASAAASARHRSAPGGRPALVREYKALHPPRDGSRVPRRPGAAALGRDRGGVRELEHPARDRLSELHDIPDSMGTAVNVVAMVFGNLGEDSGTGVTFSRDPSTGERSLYGEFLLHAQGEDVVSGIRTRCPIAALREKLPHAYQELERVARTLERHFRDLQDMEFTVERGVLYMLQTRRGKRSGQAAVRSPATWSMKGSSPRRRRSRGSAQRARSAPPPDHRPTSQLNSSPPACRRAPARRAASRSSTPNAPRRWAAPGSP